LDRIASELTESGDRPARQSPDLPASARRWQAGAKPTRPPRLSESDGGQVAGRWRAGGGRVEKVPRGYVHLPVIQQVYKPLVFMVCHGKCLFLRD